MCQDRANQLSVVKLYWLKILNAVVISQTIRCRE
jgi:hypothetical protein